MSIVNLGSINMDLVVHAPQLPKPGESLTGTSFHTTPGGKGANQAVACARLGIQTHMIGRVGNDVFGNALQENLAKYGVDIQGISVEKDQPSGVALIAIDEFGENNIIVVPGANSTVGQAELRHLESYLSGAKILLLQLEIPMEIVLAAAKKAHQSGITVILDPAPAQSLPEELYPFVDILTPNTTEATILAGFPVEKKTDAEKAAGIFLDRGVQRVIIKMGVMGAYLKDQSTERLYPALPVKAVDTVAAGDAFNGALSAALSLGFNLEEAMHWAIAAGAIAVTRAGAQTAMPDRDELLKFMNSSK